MAGESATPAELCENVLNDPARERGLERERSGLVERSAAGKEKYGSDTKHVRVNFLCFFFFKSKSISAVRLHLLSVLLMLKKFERKCSKGERIHIVATSILR